MMRMRSLFWLLPRTPSSISVSSDVSGELNAEKGQHMAWKSWDLQAPSKRLPRWAPAPPFTRRLQGNRVPQSRRRFLLLVTLAREKSPRHRGLRLQLLSLGQALTRLEPSSRAETDAVTSVCAAPTGEGEGNSRVQPYYVLGEQWCAPTMCVQAAGLDPHTLFPSCFHSIRVTRSPATVT